MTTELRPAAEYSRDEMIRLLEDGAAANGTNTARAAVHLLTFTELPGTRGFAALVEIELASVHREHAETGEVRRETVPAAWVADWMVLLESPTLIRAGGGATALIQLAASLAEGSLINLREWLPRIGGHAHVRRVAEAVLIAAGGDHFYELAGTAKLDELNAFHAEMQA